MLDMRRKPFLIAAVLFWGAYSVNAATLAMAQPAGAPATTQIAAAQTAKIVDAANAFLGTLSTDQKAAVIFAFKDAEQRTHWSNLPLGLFTRKGLRRGEMNEAQRTALTNLLATILSPKGAKLVREQMAADDLLKTHGGNRADLIYGNEYYYVSFLGAPSATSAWMFQFGGHHLGINATVVGPNVTLAPTHTGAQPVKFTSLAGEQINIAEEEVSRVATLLGALTEAQIRKAVVSDRSIDMVLGPGQDGKTLQPEGLPASEMTIAQKSALLDVIKSRLEILNAEHVTPKIVAVQENLDKTYFAWYGPISGVGTSYFRVTGPTVLLEFAPQELFGSPDQHHHNMYRDPTNEYGAAWTSLK